MKRLLALGLLSLTLGTSLKAQVTERPRPVEWEQLVPGARFMDRFLPMPDGVKGQHIWGTDSVQNRYVDNGIELPEMFRFGAAISCRLLMGSIICMYAVGPNVHPKDTCFGETRLYSMR